MQFISKLTRAKSFWVIVCCLIVDAWFFYGNGLSREATVNISYIEFINNFPEGLRSARLEPLFVTISYLLAQFLGDKVIALSILKMSILAAELYVFYNIIRLFTRNESSAIFSILFLNFSFAYISIIDTLLRNHFANLFFLIALYSIFQILQQGRATRKQTWLAIITGGILIYIHILPTIIFDLSLLLFTIVYYVIKLYRKHLQSPDEINAVETSVSIRWLFFIGTFILLLQSPYLFRLIEVKASVDDYRQSLATTVSTSQSSPDAQLESPVSDPLNTATRILTQNFRILFEYRLPSFPLFGIAIIFLSIYLFSRKIFSDARLFFLLIVWTITYLGSKVDIIFGIGTLPYRFSLMLIFPSLILFIFFLDHLVENVASSVGKNTYYSLILLSFMSINLPPIVESTLLNDYSFRSSQSYFLERIYNEKFQDKKGLTFLTNGESFADFDSSSIFLSNDAPFSVLDENWLVSFMIDNKIDYVIYDQTRIGEKGSDIGSIVNTNLNTYESSRHFQLVGEYIGNTSHLSIFEFRSGGDAYSGISSNSNISCNDSNSCNEQISTILAKLKSDIVNWKVHISHNQMISIVEYLALRNGHLIKIHYDLPKSSNRDLIIKQAKVPLLDLSNRSIFNPEVTIFTDSSVGVLYANFPIMNKTLEELSINKLVFSGKIKDNAVSYVVLTRNGFVFFVHIASLLICAVFVLYVCKASNKSIKSLFGSGSKKISPQIIALLSFVILDVAFIDQFFIEIYKRALGIL